MHQHAPVLRRRAGGQRRHRGRQISGQGLGEVDQDRSSVGRLPPCQGDLCTHRTPHHGRLQFARHQPDGCQFGVGHLLRGRRLRVDEFGSHPNLHCGGGCFDRLHHGEQRDPVAVLLDIDLERCHLGDPRRRPLHCPTRLGRRCRIGIAIHTGHRHPPVEPSRPDNLRLEPTTDSPPDRTISPDHVRLEPTTDSPPDRNHLTRPPQARTDHRQSLRSGGWTVRASRHRLESTATSAPAQHLAVEHREPAVRAARPLPPAVRELL